MSRSESKEQNIKRNPLVQIEWIVNMNKHEYKLGKSRIMICKWDSLLKNPPLTLAPYELPFVVQYVKVISNSS